MIMANFLTMLLRPVIAKRFPSYFNKQFNVKNFRSIDYQLENGKSINERSKKHTCTTDLNASKAKLISKLNFECEEDSRPFFNLSTLTLLKIYNCTQNDKNMRYCKNRLYYLSSRLKCSPAVLRETIVKRTFIYNLPFDWLESSLNVLLEMNVSPDRILRDLWVLKYHHKTIHERLTKVKSFGIDNFYPWMVRCTDQILERYINILQETKLILGENESTNAYLAKRLNISLKDVEEMCDRVPAIKTTRVTKLKSFLDFLISEGFPLEDIARRPKVLSASQETIKQRLYKLRGYGLKEINLNALSKSRKEFKKYITSLEGIYNQNLHN